MDPNTFNQLQAQAEANYQQQNPRQQFSQQMTKQTQGKGNFLTHLLPTIGSIVGGVGGTFLAPAAGTAVGGAAGGALGTLLENKLEGNDAGDNLLLNTGLGALGGVGKFAKAGLGAVQALRAGEEGASQLAGNILRFGTKGAEAVSSEGTSGLVNKAVTAADANANNGLVGKVAKGADTLGKQAMVSQTNAIPKDVAQNALRDISAIRGLGYNSFDAAAEHAPAITGPDGALTVARGKIVNSPQASKVDASGFIDMVKNHIKNGVSLSDSEKNNILSVSKNIVDKNKLAGESAPGITSASNIQAALQDIGKIKATTPAAKAVVNGIYGDVRSTLGDATSNVPVDNNMRGQIVSQLKLAGVDNPNVIKAVNQAKSWGDLAQIESKFVTASKVSQESQLSGLRNGVPGLASSGKPTLTGMANQAAGRVVEKGISTGGNLINGLIKPAQGVANPSQLLRQTAKSLAVSQAIPTIGRIMQPSAGDNQQQSPDNLLTPPPSDPSQMLQAQQSPAQTTSGPSIDSLRQAIVQDLKTTGGKNISNLMQLGQLYGIVDSSGSPTNGQQKLSSAQQTNLDGLNQASATLGTYFQQLQAAGGGQNVAVGPLQSLLGTVGLGGPQAEQARAVDQTRIDVATTLAKALSGNSRPAQSQIDQWKDSLPGLNDPPGVAQQKLQNILSLIQTRAQVYQGSGSNSLLTQLNGAQ